MEKERLLEKLYTLLLEPGESHRSNMNSHQSSHRDSLISSKALNQDHRHRKFKSHYVVIYLKCNLTNICQGQMILMSSHHSVVKIISVPLQLINQSLEDILISILLINLWILIKDSQLKKLRGWWVDLLSIKLRSNLIKNYLNLKMRCAASKRNSKTNSKHLEKRPKETLNSDTVLRKIFIEVVLTANVIYLGLTWWIFPKQLLRSRRIEDQWWWIMLDMKNYSSVHHL